MREMRRLAGLLFALALVSCQSGTNVQQHSAPTGQIGAVFKTAATLLAPGADISDQSLDAALDGAGLRAALGTSADTVIAHVRKTRAAVNSGKTASAGGQRLARVSAATSEFSIPLFASTLAESL